MRRAFTTALAALLAGCTLAGDGDWFGEIAATADVRYLADPDRDAGDGWQRLANDYQVRIGSLELTTPGIELVDRGAGAAGFDEANPPPGYTLCHNGHCHAEDGRLVPYEEIIAELGGGEPSVVATLALGAVDLIAGKSGAVACLPSCRIGAAAEVGSLRAQVVALRVEGLVRDGRTPPRIDGEQPFVIQVAVPAGVAVLRGEVELPFDRAHDPEVSLAVALHVTAALLDGVDFAGGVDDAVIIENLNQIELIAEISR